MSNISVNTITDASGGSTASINGLTPQASNMQPFNRIINGAMTIDQRNAGASSAFDGVAKYSIDRYQSVEIGNGAFTIQQVSDAPSGFTKSLKLTVTTAQSGTLNAVTQQNIEGANISDLAWGTASASPVTLSFWVKSSITGTMSGVVQDSSLSISYPFTYAVSSANTWEQKSVTIAGPTTGTWASDNSVGMTLRFTHGTTTTGASGAWATADYRGATGATWVIENLNATWQITGVQLEAGSTASSFAHENYGDTLQKCQRYYQNNGLTSTDRIYTFQYNISYKGLQYSYFCPMRAVPTITRTNGGNTITLDSVTNQKFFAYVASGASDGTPHYLHTVSFDAEL